MHRELVLFISEGGVTRTHAVPMDEDLNVSKEEIKEAWGKLVGCFSLQDILTDFTNEFIARKRAVRSN